jgi:uncharacterized RDD family membrane protein YckC
MDEHELSAIPREARSLQGQRAGVVTRLAAAAVDAVVVFVALLIVYLGYAGLRFLLDPRNFSFPDAQLFTGLLTCAVLLGCYLTVAWTIGGRTYGNLLLGLRLVGAGGGRIGPVRAAVRAAFCVVLPIGLLWIAIDRRSRSVQDLVLHTAVVYDWSPRVSRGRIHAQDETQREAQP